MSAQTAAERRVAEAQVDELLARLAPGHESLISATRKWVQKRLPSAYELVYEYTSWLVISYSPNEHGYEGVLAIRASASGVALHFSHGKELPDPEKLLQGTGKLTRSIPLEAASMLARPAVARLADEAIARNTVPFAAAGRGPLVVRPAAKKKKR
ncbi:MAG: hypothetical protein ABIZ70_13025 [Gemmatimonadales bacterium]